MIAFLVICMFNNVFSTILRDPSQYTIIKDDNDNSFSLQQDFDYNYYQDKIQDGFNDTQHSRRIFDWINDIISGNNTDKINFKTTEPKHYVSDDKISLIEIERNLTVILKQLSQILKEIHNIIKYSRHYNFKSLHDVIKTTNFNEARIKRDINATKTEEDKDNGRYDAIDTKETKRDGRRNFNSERFKTNVIATTINGKYVSNNAAQEKTYERDNDTNDKGIKRDGRRNFNNAKFKRNVSAAVINATDISNDTVHDKSYERDNNTDNKELEGSGRRMMPVNSIVNSEVKDRLLHYIDEGFDEIKNKIASLDPTKNVFSKDVNFKIGYIVASLDALDANMDNLKSDMNRNKLEWNDRKILNLYDIIKSSNNAVTNLLDVLKTYANKTT